MADIEEINGAEEMEELDNMVTMTGDDGQEYQFEFLDLINYEGQDYVVLLGEGEDEVTILQLDGSEEDDEMESYSAVEDEAVLQKIFDIFKENNSDIFDFAD